MIARALLEPLADGKPHVTFGGEDHPLALDDKEAVELVANIWQDTSNLILQMDESGDARVLNHVTSEVIPDLSWSSATEQVGETLAENLQVEFEKLAKFWQAKEGSSPETAGSSSASRSDRAE